MIRQCFGYVVYCESQTRLQSEVSVLVLEWCCVFIFLHLTKSYILLQVYSDLSVDYLKMLLLNAPATLVALGL